MHHAFLDRYSRLESPLHRLPASLKLGSALCLVVMLVVTPSDRHFAFASTAVLLAVAAALSRIPPVFLLKRLLLLEPVVFSIALLQLFGSHGWGSFLAIVVRSTLCIAAVILLSNTTPFSEILRSLRRIRMPSILVTILALMYRYLFVLIDEAERMQRARRSRTFHRTKTAKWKSAATVASQLFVRSSERAERIYAAMCARGWK
ncbi:MAG: cobalt ECF transporter T component CbiQ [Pseudomonadota bacterium]